MLPLLQQLSHLFPIKIRQKLESKRKRSVEVFLHPIILTLAIKNHFVSKIVVACADENNV
jgi:hypothetical protein